MATANITTISPALLTRQGNEGNSQQLAVSMDRVLLALNAIEGLVVLSGDLVDAVQEGESYETLTRRLEILHENMMEVSQLATEAKVASLAPVDEFPAVIASRG